MSVGDTIEETTAVMDEVAKVVTGVAMIRDMDTGEVTVVAEDIGIN